MIMDAEVMQPEMTATVSTTGCERIEAPPLPAPVCGGTH